MSIPKLTAAFLIALLANTAANAQRDPVINEFVIDHHGTDTNEYVEIFGDPNTDYSAFTIVEIEGDLGSTGLIDDGIFQVGTTDANGIWRTPYQANLFENGTSTLILVTEFFGSPGNDIDINDDGYVDTVFWTRFADGVGRSEGTPGEHAYYVDLAPNFDGNPFEVGGASRTPNGKDTNYWGDWTRNDYSGAGLPCCSGVLDGTEVINTPGAPNPNGPVADPVINEFVIDHTGTDVNEFVEIFGEPNTDYSSFTIVEIEGDFGGTGLIDDGVYQVGTTDANGIWRTPYLSNVLENGALTLLLVQGYSGTTGNDIDTNDDGTLDVAYWDRLVDGVGRPEGQANDFTYGEMDLAPNFDGVSFEVAGASRTPNGVDTNSPSNWTRNDFDGGGLPCCSGEIDVGQVPSTPGTPNPNGPAADPVINEFVIDHTGSDVNEFVEIFGEPNTDYSTFTIVEIEGDAGSPGLIDDGIYQLGTTDANGIWRTPYLNNILENGTLTLLLVQGYSGSTTNDIDINDDGVIDVTYWNRIVDGIGRPDGFVSEYTYGDVELAPNFDGVSFEVAGASRTPNGVDTNSPADWTRNNYAGEGLPCCSGDVNYGEVRNTPGLLNPDGTPFLEVNARVFLEGPYSSGTNSPSPLFLDSLSTTQPYSNISYVATVLAYDGTESFSTRPDGAVEWVRVSLRESPSDTVDLATRSALLLESGWIRDLDGVTPVRFGLATRGGYYLLVRHRNHLSIMSSDTLDLSDGHGTWDFTGSMASAFTAGGPPMKDLGDGRFGMFAADGTVDGQITAADFNGWLVSTKAVETGYLPFDFDLDGQATVSDFNLWLTNTKAIVASQAPD